MQRVSRTVGLTILVAKLAEWPTTDTLQQVKFLLRSPLIHEDLRVDPQLPLENAVAFFKSIPVRRVTLHIEALSDILSWIGTDDAGRTKWLSRSLSEVESMAMMQDVASCVRDAWPRLLLWLDFLHPMHYCHLGSEVVKELPIPTVVRATFLLFYLKRTHLDLFAENSLIYRMLFMFWLHYRSYCDISGIAVDDDHFESLSMLAEIVLRHALWKTGINKPGLLLEDADPHALSILREVVGNRPRRLYRHAVEHARILAGVADVKPGRSSPLSRQLLLVGVLAGELMRIPNHPKDVTLALVQLLQKLEAGPNLQHEAGLLCGILLDVWGSGLASDDRRSMTWALRAGVVWPIVSLYRSVGDQGPDGLILAQTLRFIARQTVYVDVLRALVASGSVGDLIYTGFEDADAINDTILDRLGLLRSTYKTNCGYDGCSSAAEDDPPRLRRCKGCFTARYCSRECQRKAWPSHRKGCADDRAVLLPDSDDLSAFDARFLVLYGREYARVHAPEMLQAIQDMQIGASPGNEAYDVIIDLGAAPPTWDVLRSDCDVANGTVTIMACIDRRPMYYGGVYVARTTMHWLENVMTADCAVQ
ncbi:hypothetical protein BD626DRAFT_633656 [Schizophyllum amplum]|uniref:MYND-type domain-containing protein n=1 Tax=Schizophyllum amplum TaxID=97359 RepID=A0A550C259_9AGAR|nr:hypothetical protein BD626DRAFT_633656 [Auriculariopsis ampla]